MDILVGIETAGTPRLRRSAEGGTLLENMLIGKDFHWQKIITALLPGRVEMQDGRLVNILPLETYLECVVGSEMNPAAPAEFLKAHAVISRSWAVGKILGLHPEGSGDRNSLHPEGSGDRNSLHPEGTESAEALVGWDDTALHTGFHVCSDDHCQRYQGRQPISAAALEAIRSTAGQVLVDNDGGLVDARFSKCCGGRTELFSTCWQEVDIPGLVSFVDPWCDLTSLSEQERDRVLRSVLKEYDLQTGGGYRWTRRVNKKEIGENLRRKFGKDVGEVVRLVPERRGPSGRICRLRVEGSEGALSIGKELWIRRLLSDTHLYSSAFEIEDDGEAFILRGRGWGHGVGLCQIGAARMALEGACCEEILSFYYPGTSLGPIEAV